MGDYSVEYENNLVCNIVFERKSIADLIGTMTKGYVRFKKEMKRAHDNNITLILVIEGNRAKVKKGHKYTKVKGISIIKKINTLRHRYELEFWYCANRVEMADRIVDFYRALGQELLKRDKQNEQQQNT